MAVLALAAAGSALSTALLPAGFAAFGLSAAQIGFSAGAALGSILFGPNTDLPTVHGPRLTDLKVQVSTYGAVIPFGYGRFRAAGNIIWATPIRENAVYTSVSTGGGKGGGGGGTQTQVSYYGTISMAVAFHNGPILGLRKIWANGKLIYNVGDDAASSTVIASAGTAAAMRVYLGSESQSPDSLIEAYKGAGNAPAYRGTAYVVFQDFNLSDYGNRPPNFEFEVVTAGSELPIQIGTYLSATQSNQAGSLLQSPAGFLWGATTSLSEIFAYNLYSKTKVASLTRSAGEEGVPFAIDAQGQCYAWQYNGGFANGSIYRFNERGLDTEFTGTIPPLSFGVFDIAGRIWGYRPFSGQTVPCLISFDSDDGDNECSLVDVSTGYTNSFLLGNANAIGGRIYYRGTNSGSPRGWGYFNIYNGTYYHLVSAANPGQPIGSVGNDGYIYIGDSADVTKLSRYTADGALVASLTVTGMTEIRDVVQDAGGYVWLLAVISGTMQFRKINPATMAVVQSGSLPAGVNGGKPAFFPSIAFAGTEGILLQGVDTSTLNVYAPEPLPRIQADLVTLDDVVEDLCERAGLSASDLVLTTLSSDELTGYVVGNRGPVRGMIEPLMASHFFDAVESDGKIKFVKRGAASVRTIEEGRLGARPDEIFEVPETLTLTRRQDLELPRQINVVYMDADNNYQVGEQLSRRLIGGTLEPRTVELPLVLSADQAKAIADTMLYVLWLARSTATFVAGREQLALEPTDVITIPWNSEDRVLRLVRKSEDPFGVIQMEAEMEDAEVYVQEAPGAGSILPDNEIPLNSPTQPIFLDIPLLLDADNGPGFYFAAKGYTEDWLGTQLYGSTDDGATYLPILSGAIGEASVIGAALNALGDLTAHGNEVIDEHNYVDVVVPGATLSGITRAQLFNDQNAAVLLTLSGPEVFQFRDAELIDTDTYRLTGLLRGRLGTEALMGAHGAGETFVLLNSEVRNITQTYSDIGQSRDYKPVSVGSTLQRTPVSMFTNTALRLKPLAPVQLGGGRNAGGDLLLQWRRRTRFDAALRDNVDAPLGETSEGYAIDILNGSSVVRTLTATTTEASYTAAQQTTDFGSPQSSIDVVVYQLSAEYGRGSPAAGTF